jgi:hypothetical protein
MPQTLLYSFTFTRSMRLSCFPVDGRLLFAVLYFSVIHDISNMSFKGLTQ